MREAEFDKEWLDVEILSPLEAMMYRFTLQNHRAPTISEMRWLRMRHAVLQQFGHGNENSHVNTLHSFGAAAATDDIRERVARLATVFQRYEFEAMHGKYHVVMDVTPVLGGEPEITVKIEDEQGRGVSHGKIVFPKGNCNGKDNIFEADDYGWMTIPSDEFMKLLQKVMRIKCIVKTETSEVALDLLPQ